MYASMQDCVNDLDKSGQLLRIKTPLDPNLEIAEVHRRIFEAGGPAILFENVIGSPFRGLSNIYGTFERTDWLFRKTLEKVQKVTELKADPANFLKNPTRYLSAPFTALSALPTKARFSKPAMYGQTTIDQLPLIKSWPMDGGAFVTMPQVMSLPPESRNMMQSNLGMYRIQLTGNDYKKRKMPEGPFGDHLGYYSLTHDFPVMKVDRVYHRKDAIWHFSIVGRPPMEDSSFGYLIHKLVKALTPGEFPGLRSINAVDAAGVHPLLLAVGGERYMPFRERVPEEIITIGNRILGSGQTSCRGEVKRELATEISSDLSLPEGYNDAHVALPGILAIQAPKFSTQANAADEMAKLSDHLKSQNLEEFPLVLVVDDSKFTAATLNNYLWVAYTRANPSHDIYGVDSYTEHKHWGCRGSLIIDARIKPHHAPELVQDPAVSKKVDGLFAKGGELYNWK